MDQIRSGSGFTLIEVLIAVAIVGILVAVGLPAYQEQILKGRRAEGKSALLKAIQLQERFYTVNGTYVDTTQLGSLYGLTPANAAVRSGENPADATGWYLLTADVAGTCTPLNTCVTLIATPRVADARCGTLTLNSRGVQTESGTESVNYCWR